MRVCRLKDRKDHDVCVKNEVERDPYNCSSEDNMVDASQLYKESGKEYKEENVYDCWQCDISSPQNVGIVGTKNEFL